MEIWATCVLKDASFLYVISTRVYKSTIAFSVAIDEDLNAVLCFL